MDLQFEIPNGKMIIKVETFFAQAGISKIRKLLKLWKSSGPEQPELESLQQWLRTQIDAESSLKQQKRYEEILESIEKIVG